MATPRRARLEARDGAHGVTTLALFFDIVFVFALTQVTGLMADDTSAVGLLHGALVVTVLWWCRVGFAGPADVGRADDAVIRLAVFAATGALFVAAITVPESFDDMPGGLSGPVVFAACYVVVRALHIVVSWLDSADDPVLRGQVVRLVPSAAVGAALLLAASQAGGALQTWLWVAAAAGDLVGARLAGTGRRPAPTARVAERHGQLVTLALGGSLVAIGIGIAQKPVSWPIIAASVLALVVAAALWWVHLESARDGRPSLHLPTVIGIVVMSLGLERALGRVAGDADYTLADPLRGLPLVALFGGVALFLLAHAGFTRAVADRPAWGRVVAAGVLVALIPPASMLPAIGALVVPAAVLVALLGHETRRAPRAPAVAGH
ncbi:low temperature requirement protein A [Pseudonocardia hydrocarbonoxydans]|uniref:Low temperature requirement protein A n=1 Tax=Pseudonocardia hydrocarbonoxydans TaxID=76726 RepID=A0A4Y3WPS4_9PSEU|nr:low temperature requirement protein A [Pseudonocardia hydrocarbonoxydans]GEC20892.1 low temperature requirement protein A [Pseudonocardia hydrocarbonoxydans]